MLRVAIASVAVGAVSAGLVEECKQGLTQLSGQSDFELAAQCRAAFTPEVCREARRNLGAQPWSEAKMRESCSQFATAFRGKDVRSLEQAVAQKAPSSVDTAAAPKAPTYTPPTEAPKKQGLVASLLDKLKEGKKNEPKKAPANPVEDYFKQLKHAQDEDTKKKGPLEAFLNQMKDKQKKEETTQPEKPGPVADFFKQLQKKPEAQPVENKPSPLADFLKKMAADKAKEEAKKALLKGKPMKLYDDDIVEQSSPSTIKFAGAGAAVAAFSALALMVTRIRRSSAPTVTVE